VQKEDEKPTNKQIKLDLERKKIGRYKKNNLSLVNKTSYYGSVIRNASSGFGW